MPRKKTAWDEMYNVRRRIDRRLKKAQQAGASEATIRELQSQSQYLRGRATAEKVSTARSINSVINGTRKRTAAQRRTAIFKQQLNRAGEPGSAYTEKQRDIFFVSTRSIWVGQYDAQGRYIKGSEDPTRRVERIMDFFYKGNSAQAVAFRNWQRRNYGTERQDLNLLIEYVNMMNAEASSGTEIERHSGSSPKNYQLITWFG